MYEQNFSHIPESIRGRAAHFADGGWDHDPSQVVVERAKVVVMGYARVGGGTAASPLFYREEVDSLEAAQARLTELLADPAQVDWAGLIRHGQAQRPYSGGWLGPHDYEDVDVTHGAIHLNPYPNGLCEACYIEHRLPPRQVIPLGRKGG